MGLLYPQVGIGTTTPSPNATLEVNGEIRTNQYGGLILPRLTVAQRDSIPVTADDDGMLIYLIDGSNRFIQVYNHPSATWQTVYPQELIFSAPLVGWDFDGLNNQGPSPFSPTTLNAAVTSSGLIRGTGLNTGTTTNSFGGNGFDSVDFNAAITDSKFVSFSITPSVGRTVSLKAINPYNIRRSGTGPELGKWQFSIDDGTTYTDLTSDITWGGNTTATGNLQPMIDLSAILALQNLTSATTVTFRLVIWNGAALGNWGFNDAFSGDDLIIIGDIR
ncbi:MAG: hypothetical protein RQ756_01310 [Flavobacteriaceae bacterium]|nr:hypothetical protein [Flavobacteriaceae bacterium]